MTKDEGAPSPAAASRSGGVRLRRAREAVRAGNGAGPPRAGRRRAGRRGAGGPSRGGRGSRTTWIWTTGISTTAISTAGISTTASGTTGTSSVRVSPASGVSAGCQGARSGRRTSAAAGNARTAALRCAGWRGPAALRSQVPKAATMPRRFDARAGFRGRGAGSLAAGAVTDEGRRGAYGGGGRGAVGRETVCEAGENAESRLGRGAGGGAGGRPGPGDRGRTGARRFSGGSASVRVALRSGSPTAPTRSGVHHPRAVMTSFCETEFQVGRNRRVCVL